MEKIFSSSHLIVTLHRGSHNTLEMQWLGFVNSEDLRSSLQEVVRLAKSHAIKSWVADNRLLRAIRPKDFEWMGDNLMLPMSSLGVKRLAILESADAMNRLGVSAFLTNILPGTAILARHFATVEEARAWATAAF